MEDVVFAFVPIVLFVSTAAVLILRPLTRRLGDLLERIEPGRQERAAVRQEVERLGAQVERLAGRLELLEERLDFTERLLRPGRRGELPVAAESERPGRGS